MDNKCYFCGTEVMLSGLDFEVVCIADELYFVHTGSCFRALKQKAKKVGD